MHPALSIIVFTVLSGLGYGLAAVLGLGLLDPARMSTKAAYVTALVLIGAGLLSSTLHLGNPQRAWRAFSQWRSSWLSREGVMSIVTFVPLLVAAWLTVFGSRYALLPGLLLVLGSAITVYCTSMIYASLKSVDAWHTPLTSACYLLFALCGGLIAASFFSFLSGGSEASYLALVASVSLLATWVVKVAWRRRFATTAATSTPESATGLGGLGKVRLLERPHLTENYLTSEMGFKVARKHADKLSAFALGFGGGLPVLLLLAAVVASVSRAPLLAASFALLALAAHLVGVFVERWLFFAEARHAVMNYYGS
jgi:DMSO reductase anchor subunit